MESGFSPQSVLLLPLLGIAIGSLGTIVGLGGGFLLVPILLLLYPDAPPATVTGISLVVVFLNSSSATVGNVYARRIDWRTGALLLVGATPAAVLGAIIAGAISRDQFQQIFGLMLIIGAGYILWRSWMASSLEAVNGIRHNRFIQERRGRSFRFQVNEALAGLVSPVGGFVSSFFGIGGGVVHMPSMIFILKIPARVAMATSLLVLVPTSLAAVLTHVVEGQFHEGWRRAGLIGAGALVGAQLGLVFSSKVNQRGVLVLLSLGLLAVGARQIFTGL